MKNTYDVDERDLIRRLRSHDDNAWAELIEMYKGDILHNIDCVIDKAARSDVERHDLFQLTFMKAFKKFDTFRGPGLKTWLIRIAVREAIMVVRHLKMRERKTQPAEKDGKIGASPRGKDYRSLEWMVTQFRPSDHGIRLREACEKIERVFKRYDYSAGKRQLIIEKLLKVIGKSDKSHKEIEVQIEMEYGEKYRLTPVWLMFLNQCEDDGFDVALVKKY